MVGGDCGMTVCESVMVGFRAVLAIVRTAQDGSSRGRVGVGSCVCALYGGEVSNPGLGFVL